MILDLSQAGKDNSFMDLKQTLAFTCDILNKCGVAYMIIGGMAMQFYGSKRPTKDIDIFIEDTEDNLIRLKQAIPELEPASPVNVLFGELEEHSRITLTHQNITIDFLKPKNFLRVQMIYPTDGVIWFDLGDSRIPVAKPQVMLLSKHKSPRAQDQRDLMFLEMTNGEVISS